MLPEPNPTMQLPNKHNADPEEEEYLDEVIDSCHEATSAHNGDTTNVYITIQVDSLLYLLTRYRMLLNNTDDTNRSN